MKAIVCMRYGPPDVLKLVDLPVPVPRSREVRIRIRATTVTSSDTYVRGLNLNLAYRLMARLALGWTAPRQPVLGMVLSGEVDCVGDRASTFNPGDQVFGFDRHRFGTHSTCAGRRTVCSRSARPASRTRMPRQFPTAACSPSASFARWGSARARGPRLWGIGRGRHVGHPARPTPRRPGDRGVRPVQRRAGALAGCGPGHRLHARGPRTGIAVEGFGVAHAHVHLVPVWQGGDLDPCRQGAVSEDELERAAELLRRALGDGE